MAGDPSSIDVVIPARDEAASLPLLLQRLRALDLPKSVIVVDDGSLDGTRDLLRAEPDLALVRHDRSLGYGAAIRAGVRAGRAARIVVIDADLEYSVEDIPRLVAALESADLVFGTRLHGQADRRPRHFLPPARRAGNRAVTAVYNGLYGQRISDLYCGLRAFRRSAFEAATQECDGFDHVIELAAAVALAGGRVSECPVSYLPRTTGVSKMRHLRESVRFMARAVSLRIRT